MKKIGLNVNPIEKMGGSIGLKVPDGDIYKKILTKSEREMGLSKKSQRLSIS